ncbi:pirin family protein [Shewanella yunxiaonensis]|uniref:Pirin family protein n=1 Tax=Shewanella yunxiaonensis TaxID=2829809 RepID=A0ABX7YR32_9GAMM|nr:MULTISPECIES: pirin family protein [Shewanella]MDF0534827.1 pirin family protein [Shewanella sp. A32]QUN04756.1 pirin family protein [Shewanella yunxiaonensis]
MITVRKAAERGQADFGWLKSRHTFSFGNYYDPRYMGVSALRVINDDRVTPGQGFATHGHRDMEIISYVISGTIAHKDSYGHVKDLPAGEFQLMSAGSGIYHSEFNPSATEPLHFLQIWIQPAITGGVPGYQQKAFAQTEALTAVVTPDGRDGTLQIKQDVTVYRLILAASEQLTLPLTSTRTLYLHLIGGELELNGSKLSTSDGISITDEQLLTVNANNDVEALVFDLP